MTATNVAATAATRPARYDTTAIRRANPLDRVARDLGLRLRPGGQGRYWALCPFHDDRRTPNLRLDVRDPDDEHFHCFAGHCRAHGDVIALVMRLEWLDFPAACARLSGHLDGARRAAPQADLTLGPRREGRPPRRWDRLTLAERRS